MKQHRIAVIESLPANMQDSALVDWSTVAAILGVNIWLARKIIRQHGVTLYKISERRELPKWGDLRQFLESRQTLHAA